MATHRIPADALPEGQVGRAGPWTVANRHGEVKAVSSRCRHQLADLSKGTLDKDGCLVCPWHGARYDLDSGRMVKGPRGFLGYHGPTPLYTQLVELLGRIARLRVRRATREGDDVVLE